MPDKEEADIKDLGKEHSTVMGEHNVAKEAGCTEELNIQHSLDMTDLQDQLMPNKEVASLEDLEKVHSPVMDEHIAEKEARCAEELNIQHNPDVKDLQWSLPDSQFPPDFLDAQVREHEAANAREVTKPPVKRDKKKSKVFRSPYITKFGYISKDEGNSINEEKQMRVVRVYDSLSSKRKSEPPNEIRKLAAILPTYLSDNDFFEKSERIDWSTLKVYEGKLGLQTDEISHNPFDVEYVQNIPQQASDSLDCGVFVFAYAEILSEGQQVHLFEFEAAS
ncbi:hypothetical protein T459_24833 [Capsicum annuum]|uniref:Ubiquitin-like protease family profile domain-containing protein n=1 Tax=Capsicum annuum TaxID=4072 RepID=A0A2G2YJ30_CAPAN|nr:hypothetical protein T459_24833 [Capsicum annuum]